MVAAPWMTGGPGPLLNVGPAAAFIGEKCLSIFDLNSESFKQLRRGIAYL
jgi:hypothetical protein